MIKKTNKKGFTLAELLIVVAIIAVLTAIAVPLFVGALDNAEKKVGEANCRAIRGLAVGEIMVNVTAKDIDAATSFWGYGKVSKDGTVTDLDYCVVSGETTVASKGWDLSDTDVTGTASKDVIQVGTTGSYTGAYKKDGDGYIVIVKIEKSTIKSE